MKKLIIIFSLFALAFSNAVAQGHFSAGLGGSYGTFGDKYVREVYSGFPTIKGLAGYATEKVGIYAFADYGEASGSPFVKTFNDYEFGSAGSEMKMTTFGIETRAFLGKSFFFVAEGGRISLKEHLWIDDESADASIEGWSYGGGLGFEIPITGILLGDVSFRYTDAKIPSAGKDIMTGENSASLGKMFLCLGVKF